jgi:taurine dioxygenase
MLTVTAGARPFIGMIEGIDLGEPLDDRIFASILDAWKSYPVLVFPNQDLTSDEQQRFAERFGPLAGRARPKEARGKAAQENPYMMLVSNIRDEKGAALGAGDYPLAFHTDGCFRKLPGLATFLYGIEVPSDGGETLFVDMNEVYEALSPATRERILKLEAINYFHYSYSRFDHASSDKPVWEVVQNAAHPMVIGHPLSKKPVVYANRHNTHDIVGLETAESKPILDEIFAEIERPARIYAHKWQIGQLVVWDNRAVQHARANCPPDQRRMLRRFAVQATETLQAYR